MLIGVIQRAKVSTRHIAKLAIQAFANKHRPEWIAETIRRPHLSTAGTLLLVTLMLTAGCAAASREPSETASTLPASATADAYALTPRPPLQVPTDYATIQSAIDVARHRDVIIVSPGTYRENIDFLGKDVTVRSTDPNDPSVVAATIIDGDSSGSVVTFSSGETAEAVLAGFTITNGSGNTYTSASDEVIQTCRGDVFESASAERFCGGGIVVNGASPTVEHNVVTGNRVRHGGGGIFVTPGSSPLIRGNVITGNLASAGAGIFVIGKASPVIRENVISNNKADQNGGGIFVMLNATPLIENNTISDNRSHGGGGIIVFNYASITLKGNTITGNKVQHGGGGAFVGAGASATMENNVISRNEAVFGGGIFTELGAMLVVENNTLDTNVAQFQGGGIVVAGSAATIKGNTITGNQARYGGGIYQEGESSSVLTSNDFQHNVAQEGGAIWTSSDSTLTLSEPDDNTYAGNQPDDIYVRPVE